MEKETGCVGGGRGVEKEEKKERGGGRMRGGEGRLWEGDRGGGGDKDEGGSVCVRVWF